MKAHTRIINSTAKEKSFMKTEPTTKVSSSKDLNVVTESTFLLMNRRMRDTFSEASLMGKV